MGTRADFYVGRGPDAEWLGSIAWDGDPGSVFGEEAGFLGPEPEKDWRAWVSRFLASRDDATLPHMGWPWPWEDSRTTDYAYALDAGAVWFTDGYPIPQWYMLDPQAPSMGAPYDEDGEPTNEQGPAAIFPDMEHRARVTTGKRSGLLVLG